jgi:hypothetical protein
LKKWAIKMSSSEASKGKKVEIKGCRGGHSGQVCTATIKNRKI